MPPTNERRRWISDLEWVRPGQQTRSQRTQALSLIASSFGLGTVIGPALAPLMVLPFLGLGLTGPDMLRVT